MGEKAPGTPGETSGICTPCLVNQRKELNLNSHFLVTHDTNEAFDISEMTLDQIEELATVNDLDNRVYSFKDRITIN